jgi:AcrR family transcriptional regulator
MTNEDATVGALPPQQQRSRDTEARLLKAAIKMLAEHGLDGATIPRIAEVAGVAPASIYRRFRDRDALIRAAFLDILTRSAATVATVMRLESFKNKTLEGVVSRLVAMTIDQYRSQPRLLQALTRVMETDGDKTFRSAALAIVSGNFERMTDVLLEFRREIRHANPRRAITFALLTMATAVEIRAQESVSMWTELMDVSDRQMQRELARMMVSYLVTEQE